MLTTLQNECAQSGFDILHPFHTSWYNRLIESEGLVESGALDKLPEPRVVGSNGNNVGGDGKDDDERWVTDEHGNRCNAILIGNTKKIWPLFIQWLADKVAVVPSHDNGIMSEDEALDQIIQFDHPFDTFLEESLSRVFQTVFFNRQPSSSSSTSTSTSCADKSSQSAIVLPTTTTTNNNTTKSYEIFWSNGKRNKVNIPSTSSDNNSSSCTNTTTSTSSDSTNSNNIDAINTDSTNSSSSNNNDYHCFITNDKKQQQNTKDANCNNSNINANSNSNTNDNNKEETSFLVSMQRVAKITGKYWHDDKATKLCIHPVYGTWMAFRAVVVFQVLDGGMENENIATTTTTTSTSGGSIAMDDAATATPRCLAPIPSPTAPPPPPLCPCPITNEEIQKAKRIFDYALQISSPGNTTTATTTTTPNNNNSENNNENDHDDNRYTIGYGGQSNKSWPELCKYLHETKCRGSEWEEVPETMKPWIQLRECIDIGCGTSGSASKRSSSSSSSSSSNNDCRDGGGEEQNWKYGDAQLLYHYTKDPEILRRELKIFLGNMV